jgi:hypothetical protein
MIERALSLDDEASLYSAAFFHKKTNLPAPERIHSTSISRPPSSGQLSRIVCYRCGSVGHISSSCTSPLIPPEVLEQEVNADIAKIVALKRNGPGVHSDEFGLWYDGREPAVPIEGNWETTQFCTNCGAAGHKEKDCRKKRFNELAKAMKNCLLPHSKYSAAETEQFFWDLWGDR